MRACLQAAMSGARSDVRDEHDLRCVVVGDNGSGKTSLLHRLRDASHPPVAARGEYLTACLDTFTLAAGHAGKRYRLHMVDVNCDTTAEGEDAMHNAHQCARLRPLALTGFGNPDGRALAWHPQTQRRRRGLPRAVALLCFADVQGLEHVERTYLPEIREHLDQCPWVLLRLRDDAAGRGGADALNAAAGQVARRHGGAAATFHRCSAFTGRGTREAVDAAVRAWADAKEAAAATGPARGCGIM